MHPLQFSALRFTLASLLLWLLVRRTGTRARLPRKTLWGLVVLGLIGNTLYQTIFMTGLSLTSATNSALIVASLPVAVALFGTILGIERATPATWLGQRERRVWLGSARAGSLHSTATGDLLVSVHAGRGIPGDAEAGRGGLRCASDHAHHHHCGRRDCCCRRGRALAAGRGPASRQNLGRGPTRRSSAVVAFGSTTGRSGSDAGRPSTLSHPEGGDGDRISRGEVPTGLRLGGGLSLRE